jgi:hypothetical protein
MGPPGAFQDPQRRPRMRLSNGTGRVEEVAVYVLEEGKNEEIIKGSGCKGVSKCPVGDPAPRVAK